MHRPRGGLRACAGRVWKCLPHLDRHHPGDRPREGGAASNVRVERSGRLWPAPLDASRTHPSDSPADTRAPRAVRLGLPPALVLLEGHVVVRLGVVLRGGGGGTGEAGGAEPAEARAQAAVSGGGEQRRRRGGASKREQIDCASRHGGCPWRGRGDPGRGDPGPLSLGCVSRLDVSPALELDQVGPPVRQPHRPVLEHRQQPLEEAARRGGSGGRWAADASARWRLSSDRHVRGCGGCRRRVPEVSRKWLTG